MCIRDRRCGFVFSTHKSSDFEFYIYRYTNPFPFLQRDYERWKPWRDIISIRKLSHRLKNVTFNCKIYKSCHMSHIQEEENICLLFPLYQTDWCFPKISIYFPTLCGSMFTKAFQHLGRPCIPSTDHPSLPSFTIRSSLTQSIRLRLSCLSFSHPVPCLLYTSRCV